MLFEDPRYVRETLELIVEMERTATVARGVMAFCAVLTVAGLGALLLALVGPRRPQR